MQNDNENSQLGVALQDETANDESNVKAPITESDAITQGESTGSATAAHHAIMSAQHTTIVAYRSEIESLEDELDAQASLYCKQLLVIMVLQLLSVFCAVTAQVTTYGWPRNPKSPCTVEPITRMCYNTKGSDQPPMCWNITKPGSWEVDPTSGQVTEITELTTNQTHL
jgi:hypothetical protein